eukprot:95047-Prorocentrum_minimum.AAC.3
MLRSESQCEPRNKTVSPLCEECESDKGACPRNERNKLSSIEFDSYARGSSTDLRPQRPRNPKKLLQTPELVFEDPFRHLVVLRGRTVKEFSQTYCDGENLVIAKSASFDVCHAENTTEGTPGTTFARLSTKYCTPVCTDIGCEGVDVQSFEVRL